MQCMEREACIKKEKGKMQAGYIDLYSLLLLLIETVTKTQRTDEIFHFTFCNFFLANDSCS